MRVLAEKLQTWTLMIIKRLLVMKLIMELLVELLAVELLAKKLVMCTDLSPRSSSLAVERRRS
jgi:hypothetical protein